MTLRLSGSVRRAYVLGSHFINLPSEDERRRLFEVCQMHVKPAGVVLIERYPVNWARAATHEDRDVGDVAISWHDIRHDGDLLHAAVTYTVDGQSWTQRFTAEILDDARLRAEAAAAGLTFADWFGADHSWARFTA